MYEWLGDYQRLVQEIDYLEFNLEQTEAELSRWVGGDLVGVKLSAESSGAKVEETIERIKKELSIKKDRLKHLILLIETFSGLDNQILRMKYIEGMTLEEVAHELGYSASHIYRKHSNIMKMMRYAKKTKLVLF